MSVFPYKGTFRCVWAVVVRLCSHPERGFGCTAVSLFNWKKGFHSSLSFHFTLWRRPERSCPVREVLVLRFVQTCFPLPHRTLCSRPVPLCSASGTGRTVHCLPLPSAVLHPQPHPARFSCFLLSPPPAVPDFYKWPLKAENRCWAFLKKKKKFLIVHVSFRVVPVLVKTWK